MWGERSRGHGRKRRVSHRSLRFALCNPPACPYFERVTLPADPAKRAAFLSVGGLLAALLLILLIFRPAEGPPGIGLTRLLLEEKNWGAELWLEGAHLNEQEPWRIQETLSARAGISTGVYKGLTRRAVNAKDPAYRIEGHLLAGNTALAAELARQFAARQTQPEVRAHWRHRQADALWRGGLEEPAAVLNACLQDLPQGDVHANARRAVLQDLASWHWTKANFRPEDPAAEFDQALIALAGLEKIAPQKASPAWLAALHRLRGRCLLRRACLTPERDQSALAEAAAAFERALVSARQPGVAAEVLTALLHDLGLSRLELGDPAAAARAFDEVLGSLQGGRSGVTQFEVRALERRVTARLNAQAFLALALTRQAQAESAPREPLLIRVRELVKAVHGMTLPDEDGPAWITAQVALAYAARLAGDVTAAESARQHALQHYPYALVSEPGVPAPREIEEL